MIRCATIIQTKYCCCSSTGRIRPVATYSSASSCPWTTKPPSIHRMKSTSQETRNFAFILVSPFLVDRSGRSPAPILRLWPGADHHRGHGQGAGDPGIEEFEGLAFLLQGERVEQ